MKSLLPLLALALAAPANAQSYRERLLQDEVIYFLLPDRFENGDPKNDRGGLKGDRLRTGFDPTHKGFFHGGDLKGLVKRLDYIQGLGATAIWLAPIFKNKPVQGGPGQESAGYHGYWVTDFTTVDPHFGTDADFKAFVDAAHARGMKVYMDIIANHTADVIQLRECADKPCDYRGRAAYPYQSKLGLSGAPINPGFVGDHVQTAENFAKLTDPGYAYTPWVPEAEKSVKVPAWLNDVTLYHNRGNSTFSGESSTMGDFVGLDDLMTEHPKVVAGMIDIFGSWIDRFGVDGFRIDTAQHVNPEFWAAFVPPIMERAKARGIPNFHIFGEVAMGENDPGRTARHTRVDKLPSVLDFAFQTAVIETVADKQPTLRLSRLFFGDPLYEGGAEAALQLPTFLGNHDAGRFAHQVRRLRPQASDEDVLKRTILGHAMLMMLRGVPTIYSGDEQGFVGKGGDQDSRQDMFASKTATYNEDRLLGTSRTTAQANFETDHPLYREIAALAAVRKGHKALTRGRQVVRAAGDAPGLFAVSRFDPDTGAEVLIAFNTADTDFEGPVQVETDSTAFRALRGQCSAAPVRPGSLMLTLPPLGYAVCAAEAR